MESNVYPEKEKHKCVAHFLVSQKIKPAIIGFENISVRVCILHYRAGEGYLLRGDKAM